VVGEKAERLILHPRDHGCHEADMEWIDEATWRQNAMAALNNTGPLLKAAVWNAGAYLWFSGLAPTLSDGLSQAGAALGDGKALHSLRQLQAWRNGLTMA